MQDLRQALHAAGWVLINEEQKGHLRYYEDIYQPYHEKILWGVRRNSDCLEMELEFHLFGYMGGPTADLKNILYCLAPSMNLKLYFEKRKKDAWPRTLAEFIERLNKVTKVDDKP